MKTKFYTFNQNNSGGDFDFDEDAGICTVVIIEATSAIEANKKAEKIGIYFDGCYKGLDCDCCGDRWCKCDESDGYDVPSIWGKPLNDRSATTFRKYCFVHHLNGTIEKINFFKKIEL